MDGEEGLSFLRNLNLSWSKSLTQTPYFTGMPNLEDLDVSYCSSLEEVHDSLGNCNKLIRFDLRCCKSLKRFPCVNVESLEVLRMKYCSSLEKFPEIHERMNQTHLTELDLSPLKKLIALPCSIGRLKSLVILNVSGCSQLESLPEEIGDLENLKKLDAKDTLISRPPPSIVCLNKLEYLSFEGSPRADAAHFVFPQVNEGLRSLQTLDLNYCNLIDGGLPDDIGCLSTLKELRLTGNNFECLPQSITQLRSLHFLDLGECKRFRELPELPPNIKTLVADFQVAARSIRSLSSISEELVKAIQESQARYKDDVEGMQKVHKWRTALTKMANLIGHDIHRMDLSCLPTLTLRSSRSLIQTPDFTGMPNLEYLTLSECESLEEVHDSLGNCNKLIRLELKGCISIKRSPQSLRELIIDDCSSLEKFPEIHRRMNQTRLIKLDLSYGKMLIALPSITGRLKSLTVLRLSGCSQLVSLPEEIGYLENLEQQILEQLCILEFCKKCTSR